MRLSNMKAFKITRTMVTGDCGQSVFLLRGDDTQVLCIDTDIQNFCDLSLIKTTEIMSTSLVTTED